MNSLLGFYRLYPSMLDFNNLGFLLLLIFNLSQLKQKSNILCSISKSIQKHFSKSNNIILKILSSSIFLATIETIIISCIQYLPAIFLNSAFGKLVGTGLNYFGLIFFIPYILILFCFLVHINPFKQIDLITPAFPLALISAKIACFGGRLL